MRDPCGPVIPGPFVDLRPDGGATPDGGGSNFCMLYLPVASADVRLVKLADDPLEKLSTNRIGQLKSVFGVSDIQAIQFNQVVAELLLSPPPGKWKPLRPTAQGFNEIWLGDKIWEQPIVSGGVDCIRGGITQESLIAQGYFLWNGRWIHFDPDALRRAGWFEWRDRWYPPLSGGALPATDNFNRASLGANWTALYGGPFGIFSSDDVYNTDGFAIGAIFWNPDTFSANQYAQLVLTALGFDIGAIGPAVRCGETDNSYNWKGDDVPNPDPDRELTKVVAGTQTRLASDTTAPGLNSLFRLEVSGSSLTAKDDGLTIFTATDTAIASGSAGIFGHGDNTVRGDDWEGGDLAGGATRKDLLLLGVGQ